MKHSVETLAHNILNCYHAADVVQAATWIFWKDVHK